MDNTASPQSEHNDGDRAADETTSAPAQPQPDRSFFGALRKGAEDARTAADKAIPTVKSTAADAVYWTAYGVSFVTVFHWAMAKGLAPESLKSGLRDGVKAAEEAARKWNEKLRQRKEKPSDPAPEPAGPSSGAVQPGAA
jgi:hypothetical protein